MRVLVTGGAGFIGSAIARELLAAGHEVTVLDDLSSGSLANLPDDPRLTFTEGSILDPSALAHAAAGCDAVSHQAAMVSVPRSLEEPARCREMNAEGTRLVLAAARAARATRAVFASSAAVYGDAAPVPAPEDSPLAPKSPYGESKLEAERLAAEVAAPGFRVAALRYFNVFGPRQALSGGYPALVAAAASAAASGRLFTLYGDGGQTRDLVSVADVARANRLALEAEFDGPFVVANIGTGVGRSVGQVLEAIGVAAGRPLAVDRQPERPGDIRSSVSDSSRAAALFGWQAERPFVDAVAETYRYYSALHDGVGQV